jgi:hypothetical protein
MCVAFRCTHETNARDACIYISRQAAVTLPNRFNGPFDVLATVFVILQLLRDRISNTRRRAARCTCTCCPVRVSCAFIFYWILIAALARPISVMTFSKCFWILCRTIGSHFFQSFLLLRTTPGIALSRSCYAERIEFYHLGNNHFSHGFLRSLPSLSFHFYYYSYCCQESLIKNLLLLLFQRVVNR